MLLTTLLAVAKEAAVMLPQDLLMHFGLNLVITLFVIQFCYYRKSKRVDYYFTFLLISASIFMIIYMLSGVKMKMAFALGLFAVFGIMRYRTVSMPVREMTYLFVLVALSVVNALSKNTGWDVLGIANALLVVLIFVAEFFFSRRKGVKYIKYDRIDLCKKSKKEELKADIAERFELKVTDVYIGSINCLKDMALIKVIYEPDGDDNIDEEINSIPKE